MSATNAAEILGTVIDNGQSQLERSSTGLAFSGLVAGLCISFGAVSLAVFAGLTGGIVLVTLLNWGQVLGSKKEIPLPGRFAPGE